MKDVRIEELRLTRLGPAEARVGMISLPMPRDLAGTVRVDHDPCAERPVAWWERDRLPRRSIRFSEGGSAWVCADLRPIMTKLKP